MIQRDRPSRRVFRTTRRGHARQAVSPLSLGNLSSRVASRGRYPEHAFQRSYRPCLTSLSSRFAKLINSVPREMRNSLSLQSSPTSTLQFSRRGRLRETFAFLFFARNLLKGWRNSLRYLKTRVVATIGMKIPVVCLGSLTIDSVLQNILHVCRIEQIITLLNLTNYDVVFQISRPYRNQSASMSKIPNIESSFGRNRYHRHLKVETTKKKKKKK